MIYRLRLIIEERDNADTPFEEMKVNKRLTLFKSENAEAVDSAGGMIVAALAKLGIIGKDIPEVSDKGGTNETLH